MGLKRILVGTDGSEHARRAVRWAADLAGLTGAEVIAAHAVGVRRPARHDRPAPWAAPAVKMGPSALLECSGGRDG